MPSPQDREAALFALAAEKPAAERAAFLDGACHDAPALRQRLEALLAAHDQPDEVLGTGAGAARPTIKLEFTDEPPDEAVGQTLGRYKLLEQIGEGGCGVVYVAEQTEPVRRRVALKVIKLGMDTKQVVARFEAERQALALMDHPKIAKVQPEAVMRRFENTRSFQLISPRRSVSVIRQRTDRAPRPNSQGPQRI
jgi:eukaryotic-like serine/threonine-protein kinase